MKEKMKKTKIPLGIKILICLYSLGVISLLLNIRTFQYVIGPFIIEGIPAVLLDTGTAAILIFLIIIMLQRKYSARYLLIISYIVNIIMQYFNLFAVIFYKEKLLGFYMKNYPALVNNESYIKIFVAFSIISTIIGTVINIIVIVYLVYLKGFFKDKPDE